MAMSGGVDSSVAALVACRDGHEVEGVTLRLWGGPSDQGCCSVADVDDARTVARRLGIEHHVFDLTEDFEHHVVEPYVAAHARGVTPNPCMACNRHLKFDLLVRRAQVLGFDLVATGHHARVVRVGGRARVARGLDRAKDQSYVLADLSETQLDRVWFPVGAMTKAEVRASATAAGLGTAAKPDSQETCFVSASGGRVAFLGERIGLRPGRVVDSRGRTLGEVPAVELVTVGQRRGLGLPGGGPPRYAVAVDTASATVTVGGAEELQVDSVEVDDLRWVGGQAEPGGPRRRAQCSAHGAPVGATVAGRTVSFAEACRVVAPGQSVVIYDGDVVVAAGTAARERPSGVAARDRDAQPPLGGLREQGPGA